MTPEDIGDIFQELEDALFAMAIRNIKRHEAWEKEEGFKWTQWQAEQIAGLRAYRANVSALVDYYFDRAKSSVTQFLRDAYRDSVSDAAETSMRFLNEVGREIGMSQQFFGVNSGKLDILINEAVQNIDTKRYAAVNRMNWGYTDMLRKADIFAQSGSYTIPQVVDMASQDFLSAGLNCVEYSNGHRVNIASYVEMALRTSSSEVTRQANGDVRDELGEHLVVSNVIGMTCPICQKWQGKVMIDDVYSSGKADGEHKLVSEAKADGFMHPNCRHQLYMYIPGVTKVADLPDTDITREKYEAEQRQRQYEREIRKYKRLRDGALDPDKRTEYDARVREWTDRLDQHLSEHDYLRKNPKRLVPGYGDGIKPYADARFLDADSPDLFQKDLQHKRMKVPEETQQKLRDEIKKFDEVFGGVSDYSKYIFFEPMPMHNELGYFSENSGRIILRGYEKGSDLADRIRKNFNAGLWSTNSIFHPIRHELAHAWVNDQRLYNSLEWKIKRGKLEELYANFISQTHRLEKIEDVKYEKACKRYLSYYATKDVDEFIAEGVAEYLNGSPRGFSRQIVSILLGQ